jgi:serine/threonine protein kinase
MHTPKAVFLKSSGTALMSTPASPTWKDDEEFYSWRASHPSSPLLPLEEEFVSFQSDNGNDDEVMINVRNALAEGRNSLLFPSTSHPNLVCKTAKSDADAMESLLGEIEVLKLIRCESGYLMRAEAVGSLQLRGQIRPAVLFPRASGTLNDRELYSHQEDLFVITSIFNAVLELHNLSIVHGDIKPHNVFLFHSGDDENGGKLMRCTLGDFGAARSTKDSKSLGNMGTLPYQAPERIASSRPTFASDVYAAGVTAYYVLTGREPFSQSTSAVMMMLAIQQQGFMSCHSIDPGNTLWESIKDCVSMRAEDRPTANEVCQRLRQFIK